MNDENPNTTMIAELRALAEFMETHPHMGKYYGGLTLLIPVGEKADLIERMRNAGAVKKSAEGSFFNARRWFGEQVSIEWYISREKVCEQVVNQRVVPAEPEKVIPSQVIPAKPERVIEETVWVCPPSLLAEGARHAD